LNKSEIIIYLIFLKQSVVNQSQTMAQLPPLQLTALQQGEAAQPKPTQRAIIEQHAVDVLSSYEVCVALSLRCFPHT
jgi:hypothetical protein